MRLSMIAASCCQVYLVELFTNVYLAMKVAFNLQMDLVIDLTSLELATATPHVFL